ncbi:unnamed protein product [Coregonus sp. 'balchen']|nr:unnamed protein product [Coregonus sp. 'balchen']
MSCQVSEFARRWNGTTATWLRRLVFQIIKTAPLVMTFGFSIWWHGLHMGQFVGFLVWAAAEDIGVHLSGLGKYSDGHGVCCYCSRASKYFLFENIGSDIHWGFSSS